jgi:hypothetical protein
MDYYYIGADYVRMESKKPCWIVRLFQSIFLDLHWVTEPEPKPIDEERMKKAEEEYLSAKARHKEEALERARNKEEDMRNFCEKMGVTVEEYPSLTHAYIEATRINNEKNG